MSKLSLRQHDRIWGEVTNRAFSELRTDHVLTVSQSQSYTNSYCPASLDILLMVLVISAIHSSVLFCSVLSSAYDEIRYWDDVYFFLRMIGTLFIEVHVTHQITSNPIECKSHLHKVCFIEAYNFLNLVSIFNFDAFFSFSTFFLRIVKVGNRNCLGFKQ